MTELKTPTAWDIARKPLYRTIKRPGPLSLRSAPGCGSLAPAGVLDIMVTRLQQVLSRTVSAQLVTAERSACANHFQSPKGLGGVHGPRSGTRVNNVTRGPGKKLGALEHKGSRWKISIIPELIFLEPKAPHIPIDEHVTYSEPDGPPVRDHVRRCHWQAWGKGTEMSRSNEVTSPILPWATACQLITPT
jgi:hypothetical protein